MGINKGYLTARKDPESDEMYTPAYAIEPLLKYLAPGSNIWCPFDKNCSNYVKVLERSGHTVVATHIYDENKVDFFTMAEKSKSKLQKKINYIISNPPFSKKDDIVKTLYELEIPYAMLFPLPMLQGQKRFPYIKNCEALIFNKRINFYKDETMKEMVKGVSFASVYLCKGILPEKLIFEELEEHND